MGRVRYEAIVHDFEYNGRAGTSASAPSPRGRRVPGSREKAAAARPKRQAKRSRESKSKAEAEKAERKAKRAQRRAARKATSEAEAREHWWRSYSLRAAALVLFAAGLMAIGFMSFAGIQL